MNARTGSLHRVDLVELFCALNRSRVVPGYDRKRPDLGPSFQFVAGLDVYRRSTYPIEHHYPGIKPARARTWGVVLVVDYDCLDELRGAFEQEPNFILHVPNDDEWRRVSLDEHNDYWPCVVTKPLDIDPVTGLLEVPAVNWLPIWKP